MENFKTGVTRKQTPEQLEWMQGNKKTTRLRWPNNIVSVSLKVLVLRHCK